MRLTFAARQREAVRLPGRVACALLALTVLLHAGAAHAATFTVTKTADTNDGNCNADCSLREAIAAANANGGADTVAFNIPTSDPGYNGGTGVFTITVSSLLPALTNPGTTVDGTTQATNVGNTNPGLLGIGGTVGVGADGRPGTGDEPTLSQVAAPEIEIANGGGLAFGLRLQANNSTVRGIAIFGFGTGNGTDSEIFTASGITTLLIEQNVIGSAAAAFTDPGAGSRGWQGIYSDGANNATVRNNLIGFGGIRGILLAGNSSNWTIEDNEIRDSSLDNAFGDGVALDPATAVVTGNLITGAASQGVVVRGATGSTFSNNTISGNGVGTVSASGNAAGMTFRPTGNDHTVELNLFTANYGAGLSVNNGATGIAASRNAFSANGTITARNGDPATGQIGIDLNTSSDDASTGTAPFVSLNDSGDTDAGGNNLLNYPVIDTAVLNGSNLELSGWARPGSVIEFFVADPDGSGFGEGATYLFTLTEGSGADSDGSTSTYGPGPINGIAQGTDTTDRFEFTQAVPVGVTLNPGDFITATARDGAGNTSEFSGNRTVTENLTIFKRALWPDGTPIADGATLPEGIEFKFLLYVSNRSGAVSDVSLQDVLDPLFGYEPGSLQLDNSVAACAAQLCTPAEEAAIFAAASAAPNLTDAIDGDSASFTSATVDVGDQNAANAQLDISGNRVLAITFSARVQ